MPILIVFSSRAPTSLTLNLLSKAILEIVDIGSTIRSSMTIYVTTPFTKPPSASDDEVEDEDKELEEAFFCLNKFYQGTHFTNSKLRRSGLRILCNM